MIALKPSVRSLCPPRSARHAAPALAALLACWAAAAAPARAAPAPHPSTLGVDDLRPGMKGIGKTVFRGTEVSEFEVEIIGVLRRISPSGDMILARASGGPLAQTGIAAGMSGSPVYVDGKLIGAVAFSWSFAKEPIAGITPIREMLEVMDREDRAPDAGAAGAASMGDARERREARASEDAPGGDAGGVLVADADARRAGVPAGTRLSPIRTPVVVAGFDPRVVDRVAPWLERFGFAAMSGGGVADAAAGEAAAAYVPEPGAAIGVQLLSGDAAITAFGTVTHRAGERLIAFGHPLFQAGDVDLPMTGAYIHGVLPSSLSSFKLGSPLAPLGTLTQDRRTAISGNIGRTPAMVPVTVTLRTGETSRTYRYSVVRDKTLMPGLVEFAAVNSVVASEAAFAEATIESRVAFRLTGGRELVLQNLFSGFSSLEKLGDEASGPALLMVQNRFERVGIEAVDVALTLAPGRRTAHVEAIAVSRNPVRAGETITVRATVKPYQGEPRIVPLSLAIPAGADDGDLTLRVCDASSLDESDTKRAPQRFEWEDFDTLLESVAERRRNDHVYAQLEAPGAGIAIAGREFPSVPRSMFAVIDSDRHTENAGVVSASVLAKAEADVGLVVTGCKTLTIRVDHRAR